uniref:Uncharacterized protein n=1 Tax=Candidatus Kentrum sp. LPFa TaxID=2126335 RepID=A0A450WNH2_9GAMM|nr:MAG: hypothetical protein BECKLPF1236B_GA0070989_11457 [Candidatus Kentron sp. LPFa]
MLFTINKENSTSCKKKPSRKIITFDWAIKTILRDKANVIAVWDGLEFRRRVSRNFYFSDT